MYSDFPEHAFLIWGVRKYRFKWEMTIFVSWSLSMNMPENSIEDIYGSNSFK